MGSKKSDWLLGTRNFGAVIIDITTSSIDLRSVDSHSLTLADTCLLLPDKVQLDSTHSIPVEHGRFDLLRLRDTFDRCILNHKGCEPVIILGNRTDPFHPVKGKFDVALRLIEFIVSRTAKPLLIQTRSPLVVMSLPVLRNNASRITVSLAIETDSDYIHNRYLPSLPRPSERLTAAETLKIFEIPLMIQVAPILGRTIARSKLLAFASNIGRIADALRILSFRDLGGNSLANDASESKTIASGKFNFSVSPHQLLTQELLQICPEKLTQFGMGLLGDEHEKEAA